MGNIFLAYFGPLTVPIECHLKKNTAYLSIFADHVHPFMTTMCLSSNGCFHRLMHHVKKAHRVPECDSQQNYIYKLLNVPADSWHQCVEIHYYITAAGYLSTCFDMAF